MLTVEEIRKKIFELPDLFHIHYKNKKWWQAKHCYDTAVAVSVFIELSDKEQIELFGNRAYREEYESLTSGLFNEIEVDKVYLECIKVNQTRENEDFRKFQKKRSV